MALQGNPFLGKLKIPAPNIESAPLKKKKETRDASPSGGDEASTVSRGLEPDLLNSHYTHVNGSQSDLQDVSSPTLSAPNISDDHQQIASKSLANHHQIDIESLANHLSNASESPANR